MTRPISTVLVIEDEAHVLRALARRATRFAERVLQASTVAEALEHLQHHPDLIILDVRLPDGSGEDVARAARNLRPRPMIVALSGKASAAEGFGLAQMGVGAYLAKPLIPEELTAAVEELRRSAPRICEAATDAVGELPMPYVQKSVRNAMLKEALTQVGGNMSHAAELLGVTRQAVQQHLRKPEGDPDSGTAS